ncbi:ATP-binding protein [Jatrophihabitans sp. YIM 134969]
MTPDAPARVDAGGTRVEVHRADDVVRARHLVRELATGTGFDLVTQTKLVTAVSELARNAVIHGGGGTVSVEVVNTDAVPRRTGIVVVVADDGPGITDLDQAMTGGWSSGTGLGLGLPGSQRLVHDFTIESTPGRGTRVRIAVWRRSR